MNVAFRHPDKFFLNTLSERLATALADHDFVDWKADRDAPSRDVEVLLSVGPVTRAVMEAQEKLALVQTTSAGHEGLDVDAATELGIWAGFAPSGETGNAVSVAEMAVFLAIGAARHANVVLASTRDPDVKLEAVNHALQGKAACIVGFGAIGRELAKRLRSFDMTLVAVDDDDKSVPDDVRVFRRSRFHEALGEAGVVFCCAPSTDENDGLFDAQAFAAMKDGAVFVNVSRGSLVDEAALADGLSRGKPHAAGLDVLRHEPPRPDDPLLAIANVFVTPHVAGGTDVMLAGTVAYVREVLADFAAGRRPPALLNEPAAPRRALATNATSGR